MSTFVRFDCVCGARNAVYLPKETWFPSVGRTPAEGRLADEQDRLDGDRMVGDTACRGCARRLPPPAALVERLFACDHRHPEEEA